MAYTEILSTPASHIGPTIPHPPRLSPHCLPLTWIRPVSPPASLIRPSTPHGPDQAHQQPRSVPTAPTSLDQAHHPDAASSHPRTLLNCTLLPPCCSPFTCGCQCWRVPVHQGSRQRKGTHPPLLLSRLGSAQRAAAAGKLVGSPFLFVPPGQHQQVQVSSELEDTER